MIIYLHQQDEKIKGVAQRRPNLDIGLVIFKRNKNNGLDLVAIPPIEHSRQSGIQLSFDVGSYIILPRTTGCTLRRPYSVTGGQSSTSKQQEIIQLLINDKKQKLEYLNPLVESTIIDIFRKFDMLLTRELAFIEFKGFFECIDK